VKNNFLRVTCANLGILFANASGIHAALCFWGDNMCGIVVFIFRINALEQKLGQILIAMSKLGHCAEQKWRKLRGFYYLAKVITGVTFKDGIETTNPGQIAA
jgi:hypothetical protein